LQYCNRNGIQGLCSWKRDGGGDDDYDDDDDDDDKSSETIDPIQQFYSEFYLCVFSARNNPFFSGIRQ
jgi:hypothetical protein